MNYVDRQIFKLELLYKKKVSFAFTEIKYYEMKCTV